MPKILHFFDHSDDVDLNDLERSRIKDYMRKYEKYFNFHNNPNFDRILDEITGDCIEQLNLDSSKGEDVKDYLQTLYDLSDGLSVVMAPDPQFQYTNIDQVQRFQY